MASLYPALAGRLAELAHTITASRSTTTSSLFPIAPVSPAELSSQVRAVWDGVNPSAPDADAEVLRSVMDMEGRDLVIGPIVDGELVEPDEGGEASQYHFQAALQDRLDIALTLYEVVYEDHPPPSLEPGAIFIPLVEELVELISQSSWRLLWTYVETRARRFTLNMPSSKGKALPLLRTINAFLRTLPKTPDGLAFRGRVHQFASSVIGIADKSAINMRGDYGDVKTTWEEEEQPVEAEEAVLAVEGGDVQMEDDKAVSTPAEEPFYATLWSLQQFFANPPSLGGPAAGDPPKTPFEQFMSKTDAVLPRLFAETRKQMALRGQDAKKQDERKRKREANENADDDGEGGFFYPRYLTGKRLLEHELADASFRRQILVQYFILFQFLLNLTPASANKQLYTGGMPKTFVIDGDHQVWVKSTVTSIRDELRKMDADGGRFEETVVALMDRERRYAQWKNEQCPEAPWEIPPLDPSSASQAAEMWKRRMAPPARYPFRLGSRTLSRLWDRGYTGIDQLKQWKRSATVESLDKEIEAIEADEEDDKALGRDAPAENFARKTSLTWRALRIAAHTDLRHFAALVEKRDLHLLLKNVRSTDVRPKVPGDGKDDAERDGTESDAGAEAAQDAAAAAGAETGASSPLVEQPEVTSTVTVDDQSAETARPDDEGGEVVASAVDLTDGNGPTGLKEVEAVKEEGGRGGDAAGDGAGDTAGKATISDDLTTRASGEDAAEPLAESIESDKAVTPSEDEAADGDVEMAQ